MSNLGIPILKQLFNRTSNFEKNIFNTVYPVGSIYMSTNNTNPGSIFGGTWEQIKDKFLLSAGDTYANGTTGGEASHILTTAEMPQHNHTFTGTAHSHGLNNHTHTYEKSATATGQSSGSTGGPSNNSTGSTAITANQLPKHTPAFDKNIRLAPFGITVGGDYSEGFYTAGNGTNLNIKQIGNGEGHTHTLNNHTHSLNNHTHSITLTSTNSGKASGNTADATQGGTIGNTGSGNAHNNMPPYLTVFVWKRTA